MNLEDLTPEQMEKAKACKTADELVALAKSEGVELSDKQLEAIAGGDSNWDSIVDCEGQACYGYNCTSFIH